MSMHPLSRRTLLKSAVAAGTVLAAPAIVSTRVLASSGELRIHGWGGFQPGPILDKFAAETGIKVSITEHPENDTMFAQAKLGNPGEYDLAEPSSLNLPLWHENGLIEAFDRSKLEMSNISPGMPGTVEGDTAFFDGELYYAPTIWGGEAMAYTDDVEGKAYGEASLADIFDSQYEGQVTMRPYSSLAAMGRLMAADGRLSRPYTDVYKDEATMREIYDQILAEITKYKSNVGQWWNSDNEAVAAFMAGGCRVGLIWESPARTMASENAGVRYVAPKEGAFGWTQGFVRMKASQNSDQAHEFVKWLSRPQNAIQWATLFTGISASKDTTPLMDEAARTFVENAYPADAVSNMFWWPPQNSWFMKVRGEYIDRWRSV